MAALKKKKRMNTAMSNSCKMPQSSNRDASEASTALKKPFYCEMCKCNFSDNSNLEYHLSIHKSEKPFHCETCKLLFPEVSELRMHMQSHSDFINQPCPNKPRFSSS